MTHEKRLLLALVLSVIVCTWWAHRMSQKQKIIRQKQLDKVGQQVEENSNNTPLTGNEQTGNEQTGNEQTGNEQTGNEQTGNEQTGNETGNEQPKQEVKHPKQMISDAKGSYANDVYYVEWTNQGAALKQVKFKKFWNGYCDKKKENWQNDPENWLDIIPDYSSKVASLMVYDADVELQNANWKPIITPDDPKNPDVLEFELELSDELVYRKKFTFIPSSYMIEVELTIDNKSSTKTARRKLQLAGGAGILAESPQYQKIQGWAMHLNEKDEPLFESYSYKDLTKDEIDEKGRFKWAAISNSYFAHVVEVDDPEYIDGLKVKNFYPEERWLAKAASKYRKHGENRHSKLLEKDKPKQAMLLLTTREITVSPKEQQSIKYRFYVASKPYLANLQREDKSFRKLYDYGMLAPIISVLLWVLALFYKLFHSYGVAIICLTFAIKICLYPLSRKQQIAMRDYQKKMGKVQPQMKKLQEKYKNNPKKLQEEMIKLYKEQGVNPIPLKGCLPILIQLPIFIALYRALSYSMELRQAGFLWIGDLSQPDRLWRFGSTLPLLGEYLNILPLVMTVIWFIQMKTAPAPEDPQMKQQQKVMMFMPIIFGFMFYNIASGLVLYWLVMQLITVVEQLWIKGSHDAKAA